MKKDTPTFQFALREGLTSLYTPSRGEPLATGWDVRAAFDTEELVIQPFQYFKIPLGFRAFSPKGWWFQLHPRSSSFAKKHMHCLVGTIDETYDKELIFAGQYIADNVIDEESSLPKMNPLVIKRGDAIGQIIPVKRVEMNVKVISNEEFDKLSKERNAVRDGGFGSTTK